MRQLLPRLERPAPFGPPPALSPAAPSHAELAALYVEHFRFVWRSLRRLGVRPSGLDDALQDVFLVAHRKLAAFEGRSSHRSWLFGIALRVAREHRRREGRLELDQVAVSAAAAREHDAVDQRRRVLLLDTLLGALNAEQREVFVMAEVEGFSAPEIAEALGIKLNTVYSRLRLGRRQFERALARHGGHRAQGEP